MVSFIKKLKKEHEFFNLCFSFKGIWDCISGDDELGCSQASCPTTFACNDPLVLPSDQPRCYIHGLNVVMEMHTVLIV